MKRATKLSEIYQACTPRPLSRDQLAEFFVQTEDARDAVMSRRDELRRKLQDNADDHTKLLLAGHRGCGKSTELVKLSEEIKEQFFTVAFSVERECNIADVAIEDVLVVLMERIVDACNAAGLGEELAGSTELYERLTELSQKPRRNVVSEPVTMLLLQSRALVEYNGEGWFRVHPLVRELISTD